MTLELKKTLFLTEQTEKLSQWEEELAEEQVETIEFFNQEGIKKRIRFWMNRFGACSPYLTRLVFGEKSFLKTVFQDGYDATFSTLMKTSFEKLYRSEDRDEIEKGLRILKRRAALLIAMADVSGEWHLAHVTRALSVLAEASLHIVVSFLLRGAHHKGDIELSDLSHPENGSGFIVLAMGKLGAMELNYSSDVDLIVLYDEERVPYIGKKDIGTFFVKLTRDMISLMEDKTAYGYVFRTDLRLRPDPGSTPVALSTAAAGFYYESFAQNWERAAYIKARALAGDKKAGNAFLKEIRPFIWRRSTDFYALQQIHEIKRSLGARSADMEAVAGYNVKLGPGGIREIEFFTQLQQLLWGGRDMKLRSKGTLNGLKNLVKAGWASEQTRHELSDAYVFLRTLEHRLQMIADEQTQTLPKTQSELDCIAAFMGFEKYEDFVERLDFHRKNVQKAYDSLFAGEETTIAENTLSFSGADVPVETVRQLSEMGFKEIDFIGDAVRGWLSGRYRAMRSDKARGLIAELLPFIFKALSQSENADASFVRFDEFLKGLPAGVQLFSLFQSRPALLDLLAEVMSAPSFASELTRRPELFDAVLSPNFFSPFSSKEELQRQSKDILTLTDDEEQALEVMRRFVREQRFRCGILYLRGLIEKEALGQNLTAIVSAVLSALCPVVTGEFEARYGKFSSGFFSFVLLGKAGSGEMSFTSDLDILFVYDAPADEMSEGGKSSLSVNTYYARLAQRLINAVSVNTKEGILWPVDMRLRPSGNAGPVAVSFEAFRRYYAESAWTWELMALTKARIVWGEADKVQNEIQNILTHFRDKNELCKDVLEMNEKVKGQFKTNSVWDIKYCDGGMVDIEFAAQYLQLISASEYSDILQRAVLPVLEKALFYQIITQDAYNALSDAYRFWLSLSGFFSLSLENGQTPDKASEDVQKRLCAFCNQSNIDDVENIIREKAEKAALYRLFR